MTLAGEPESASPTNEPVLPSGALGVVLRDPLPWHQFRQLLETAEDTGYRAAFVPEIAGREAFATLAAAAETTSRLVLGSGVVTVWSRSPTIAAMGAATVHDVSDGRMVLGVGAGSPPRGQAGADRPLERVREYVRIVRTALSGDPVEGGEALGSAGFSLSLALEAGPPPIWLAALGDRMVGLAGEMADGVLLNWCTPERVRAARTLVDDQLRASGRDPEAVTVAVYVRACLGVDRPLALEALQPMAGQYASFPPYLRQFEAMGLGEPARAAAAAVREGRPDDVPAELVDAVAVTGGRADAEARLDAYRAAGADVVLCYPVAARDPFSSLLRTILAAAPSPAVER
jgi:5,10-methylenetetrahydromethanopterin reductase